MVHPKITMLLDKFIQSFPKRRTWTCFFGAWKKFQKYSPKCWFDGDFQWHKIKTHLKLCSPKNHGISSSWWFGDPKEPCKKPIPTPQKSQGPVILWVMFIIIHCCFTRHPLKKGCLGYQVGVISLHLQLGILAKKQLDAVPKLELSLRNRRFKCPQQNL